MDTGSGPYIGRQESRARSTPGRLRGTALSISDHAQIVSPRRCVVDRVIRCEPRWTSSTARTIETVPTRNATLIALSGLPGVGKTTLARRLSSEINAVHLRLDTIEAALTASGMVDRAGGWTAVPDAGYRVAYALARDHLEAGHDVIADSVNPLSITRHAWSNCAQTAHAELLDIEVICSDRALHKRRIETRTSDLDGLTVPTWQQVEERTYEPWLAPVLRVDTARGIDQAVEVIVAGFRGLTAETQTLDRNSITR